MVTDLKETKRMEDSLNCHLTSFEVSMNTLVCIIYSQFAYMTYVWSFFINIKGVCMLSVCINYAGFNKKLMKN